MFGSLMLKNFFFLETDAHKLFKTKLDYDSHLKWFGVCFNFNLINQINK